jgi:hypothetical protein
MKKEKNNVIKQNQDSKNETGIQPIYYDYPDKAYIKKLFHLEQEVMALIGRLEVEYKNLFLLYFDVLPWKDSSSIKLRDGCWATRQKIYTDNYNMQCWEYRCMTLHQVKKPFLECKFHANFYPEFGIVAILQRHNAICFHYNHIELSKLIDIKNMEYNQCYAIFESKVITGLHKSLEHGISKQISLLTSSGAGVTNYLFKIYPLPKQQKNPNGRTFPSLLTEGNISYDIKSGKKKLLKDSFAARTEKMIITDVKNQAINTKYKKLLDQLSDYILNRNLSKAYMLALKNTNFSSIFNLMYRSDSIIYYNNYVEPLDPESLVKPKKMLFDGNI